MCLTHRLVIICFMSRFTCNASTKTKKIGLSTEEVPVSGNSSRMKGFGRLERYLYG